MRGEDEQSGTFFSYVELRGAGSVGIIRCV